MFPTSNYTRRFHNKKTEVQHQKTQKIVTFKIEGETYAIAIDLVLRVIYDFTPQGVLESDRALIKYESEMITLVDISSLFFTKQNKKLTYYYLIICTLKNGDRLGIPVSELPAILDVPEDKFEEIPSSYREGTPGSLKAPEALEKLVYTESGAIAFYLNLDKLIPIE